MNLFKVIKYYLLRAMKIIITCLDNFFNVVNETEFKAKLSNNPGNLWSCSRSFCSTPQPSYKINNLDNSALPENKYILHHQCLPGCSSATRFEMIPDEKFEHISGAIRKLAVVNHLECSSHTPSWSRKPGALRNFPSESHDSLEEVPHKISMYILYNVQCILYNVQFLIVPSGCCSRQIWCRRKIY